MPSPPRTVGGAGGRSHDDAGPGPDLAPPTTLLLVRHGRTVWTGDRVCGGDDAGPPPDAAGTDGVRRVAELIAAGSLLPEPAAVAAVVTSPQVRARAGADLLAGRLAVPVTEDAGWSEVRLGAWHGATYAAIAAGWPEEFRAWRTSPDAAPPGGESVTGLRARVVAARDRLVAAHPGRVVVVVTHAGPVRALVADALEAGPAAYWRLRIDPASVTVLRVWADGGLEVAAVNALPPGSAPPGAPLSPGSPGPAPASPAET